MDLQVLQKSMSVADMWQMGKTPASIKFVQDAEKVMAASKDTIIVGALTDAVNKVKFGELILIEFTNPLGYINHAG